MNDHTEVCVILDRSGSMETCRKDHEGGLKSFVADLRDEPGVCNFTLIQFSTLNPFEIVYDGVPVADVKNISLEPNGGTPLLDAIGRSASHLSTRLDAMQDKPGQIVVMIVTDGEENASREFTKDRIRALVAEKEKAGWKFIYLGANVDAFYEAHKVGVVPDCAFNFSATPVGTAAAYQALSSNTKHARHLLRSGANQQAVYACYAFSPEQRAAAGDPSSGADQWNHSSSASSLTPPKNSEMTTGQSQQSSSTPQP